MLLENLIKMAKQDYIFTSESVSEGHPDKVCDIISDSVLDLYLSKFPESRVACETLVTTNTVGIFCFTNIILDRNFEKHTL